jgi:hypothetical protein
MIVRSENAARKKEGKEGSPSRIGNLEKAFV